MLIQDSENWGVLNPFDSSHTKNGVLENNAHIAESHWGNEINKHPIKPNMMGCFLTAP